MYYLTCHIAYAKIIFNNRLRKRKPRFGLLVAVLKTVWCKSRVGSRPTVSA